MNKVKGPKRINYLNDELGKNLFKNNKLLISFLNSALKAKKKEISEVTYEDREIDPRFYKGKKSFVDIYVSTRLNESINLEFQKIKVKNFIKGVLRYLMRLADSIGSGEDDGQLFRTVNVSLINYNLEEIDFGGDFHNSLSIKNDNPPYKTATDVIEMHFISIKRGRELNRDILNKIDTMSPLEKWTAFFCNSLTKAERKALIRSEPMLLEATEINNEYLSKRENRIAYIKAQKLASLEKAEIEQAKSDAVDERNKEIVQKMKKKNMDVTLIQEITGWTEEQILACPV